MALKEEKAAKDDEELEAPEGDEKSSTAMPRPAAELTLPRDDAALIKAARKKRCMWLARLIVPQTPSAKRTGLSDRAMWANLQNTPSNECRLSNNTCIFIWIPQSIILHSVVCRLRTGVWVTGGKGAFCP